MRRFLPHLALFFSFLLILSLSLYSTSLQDKEDGTALEKTLPEAPTGMVLIPGGSFDMGGDAGLMGGGSQSHNTSYPIHKVRVDSFWMDATEVTNREFNTFVEATGYVSFAERPLPETEVAEVRLMMKRQLNELEWLEQQAEGAERRELLDSIAQIKKASESLSGPAGAIVFDPPEEAVNGLGDINQWWQILPGATWRTPDGPGSSWKNRMDHPVVNVSPEDAAAYAAWVGKRLPTEAEWERAARGGLERNPYAWGDVFAPLGEGVWMANIWQGVWPYENTGEDGFVGTAPVKSFPANDYGLFDIAGNVWEIVGDRYHPNTYAMREDSVAVNPQGPEARFVASQPRPTFITRGGSFLCSDSWCSGYQPGSRQPLEYDSPANHTGFRLVKDLATKK